MAYNPTDWRDRVVERPRTYSLQDNGDGTYTLLPMPGNIIEPGTPVNAGNMNKIEQGIADTSQGLEQHINANTGVHGATPNATPSRIVMRDGNGRAAVANPVNNNHIANKQYVDDAADAAEQAAIDWVRERGIGSPGQTIDDLNNATESGRWYVAGASTANTPDGLSWWTVLVAYRNSSNLAQIAFRTISGATQTKIRFLSGGTWTSWENIWTSFNLPSPARTNVDNDFTITQTFNTPTVTGNWTVIRMKRDQNGVGDYGLSMRNDGRLSIWDYINQRTLILFGDDRVTVGAGVELNAIDANGIKVANQPVWYAGNQGNPNNLNTSSKQIVGAINELFTTVSDGKQAIRDAIADAGGTPPSGSPDQYTHQDLAAAISTVRKYANGSEPTDNTTSMTIQVRGINFDVDVLTGDYQTSDGGFVAFTIIYYPDAGGWSRLFVNKASTTASDPVITKVSGGFDITISRPAGTGFDWEAWGGRP